MSVVFTWDKDKAEDMASAWRNWGWTVNIGGPAYDDPGGEFFPGKYIREGIVTTHRGCIRECPWCYIPKREGRIRTLPIHAGNILQDNNILACPKDHQRKVFEMLRTQRAVSLRGGLDSRLITDWAVEEICSLRLADIWLAYDSTDNSETLTAIDRFRRAGLKQDKIRCYVLIGYYGETLAQAEWRCQDVLNRGAMPFAQLYDGYMGDDMKEWKALARKWSRPAIYRHLRRDYEEQD